MRKGKITLLVLALITAFAAMALLLPGMIGAGELEPTAPPGPTMKTLQDIYDKLNAIAADIFEIKTGCPSDWRFCDLGDGTVLDMDTGLIWLKDANCFGYMDWDDAMAVAAGLEDGECGLTDGSAAGDWRLPTKEEWEAFVAGVYPNNLYTNPDLCNAAGTGQWSEGDAFTGVQSYHYWSSTEYAADPGGAWRVHMREGRVGTNGKGSSFYVWPVRGGN